MKNALRKTAKIILYVLLTAIIILAVTTWYYFSGVSAVDKKEEFSFMFKNGVNIVSAMVNDSGPFNFILDTGTDPSVIDENLADRLSFYQLSLGEEDVGEDQPIEISIPLPMKLKVGTLPAARKMFLSMDIKGMSEEMGMPIHGILGYNFIKDNILQIDYERQIMTFFPFDTNPYQVESKNVKRLSLSFIDEGKLPRISVLVNGKPLNTTIDTGSNQGLTLFNASVDYLDLDDELADVKMIESLSYGGVHKTQIVEGLALAMDDWTIDESTVNLDLESEKAQVSLDVRGGNIGNRILKNYRLTLDYKNSIVWFERKGS